MTVLFRLIRGGNIGKISSVHYDLGLEQVVSLAEKQIFDPN